MGTCARVDDCVLCPQCMHLRVHLSTFIFCEVPPWAMGQASNAGRQSRVIDMSAGVCAEAEGAEQRERLSMTRVKVKGWAGDKWKWKGPHSFANYF